MASAVGAGVSDEAFISPFLSGSAGEADLVSFTTALGSTGTTGIAGTAARGAADLAAFVGAVVVGVVDRLGGWVELGVVGAVEVPVSESGSCADGVSERVDGCARLLGFGAGDAFGVGVLTGGASVVGPDPATEAVSIWAC